MADELTSPAPTNQSDTDALVAAAYRMIHRLNLPRSSREHQAWIMHIPADPVRDPDIVISAALAALVKERDAAIAALNQRTVQP